MTHPQEETTMSKKTKLIIYFSLISFLFIFLLELPSYVKKLTVKHLEEITGRKISSEKLRFNYFTSTLYLENFKILESDENKIFIAFDSFNVNINPLQLIRRTLSIEELTLVNPQIHVELLKNKRNFDDILKKMESEKSEDPLHQNKIYDSSEDFLKKIEVRNISIEKLTFYYLDEMIKTNNKFTLNSPEVSYEGNILNFSSKVDFLDGSIANLKLYYDKLSSDFQGDLSTENLILSDKLYLLKKIFDLKEINGLVNSNLKFLGNTKENRYFFSGEISLDNFDIKKEATILSIEKGLFIFPALDFYNMSFDISQIEAQGFYFDSTQNIREKNEVTENKNSKTKDIKLNISKIDLDDGNIIIKNNNLNKISMKIENFNNLKGTTFPIKFDVNLNGNTEIGTQSQITLMKDFKDNFSFGMDSISGRGRLTITGKNISFIENFTGEKLPFTVSSGDFSYAGDYKYTFPNLSLGINLGADRFNLRERNSSAYSLDIEKSQLKNSLTLDFIDYRYDLSGPAKFENFKFNRNGNRVIIGGNSIEGVISSIKEKSYLFDSLDAAGLYLNIEGDKENKEDKNLDKTESFPKLNVNSLTIKDGSLNLKYFKLETLNFKGTNIGTLEGGSSIDLSFLYNSKSPVGLNGKIKKDIPLKKYKDFMKLDFSGKLYGKKVSLEEINFIFDKTHYALDGVADIDTGFSYSESILKTKNSMYLENFIFSQKESTDTITLKNATGNFGFNFDLKNFSDYSLEGDFILNNLMGKAGDKRPLFRIEEFSLTVPQADKKTVSISNLKITKPLVNLHLMENENNIIFAKVEKEKASKPKSKDGRNPLLEINILDTDIYNGRINIFTEDIRYSFKNVAMSLKNFSTSKDKEFSIDIESRLTGVGKLDVSALSSLEKNWDFSPTSFNFDGFIKISNLDLLDFNNYLEKYLPNRFNSGKVFYTGNMELKKGNFSGENIITVKNLQLGEKTDVESSIPLGLAVKVLKDRKDQLIFDIPVSGDFNNPTFRVYKVVLQTIRNILIRAATSPVTILSNTFNFKNEDVQYISFEFLSTDLASKEIEKLEKIAEILNSKEGVKVNFTLFTDFPNERTLLNERLKENMIFKRNTENKKLNREIFSMVRKRRESIEQFFRKKLLEKKVNVEISTIERGSSHVSIDFIFE